LNLGLFDMETLFFIGYVIAVPLLVLIIYRLKVLGFKSYFHNIAEFVGREKNLFFEINHFCLVFTSLLAPVILFAACACYPVCLSFIF